MSRVRETMPHPMVGNKRSPLGPNERRRRAFWLSLSKRFDAVIDRRDVSAETGEDKGLISRPLLLVSVLNARCERAVAKRAEALGLAMAGAAWHGEPRSSHDCFQAGVLTPKESTLARPSFVRRSIYPGCAVRITGGDDDAPWRGRRRRSRRWRVTLPANASIGITRTDAPGWPPTGGAPDLSPAATKSTAAVSMPTPKSSSKLGLSWWRAQRDDRRAARSVPRPEKLQYDIFYRGHQNLPLNFRTIEWRLRSVIGRLAG